MSRTFRKVHLTSMSAILKNITMRKYMIQYCRENDGFITLHYYNPEKLILPLRVDLTDSMSMKNAEIPDDVSVELDVQGNESETIIDFIIKNIDGMTLVE